MRHLALAIAAVFMLALVAPAFAQPFADVPADHWAFDAIAELAAKGILEGYPDGTFKGDRAMTRYEMAMALARILARIEAIKIPPPPKIPPPEVRRADIDRLQRLINEFRAELSALGVRITAVEEELAALKARLDNVKITGSAFFRYQGGKGTLTTAGGYSGTDGSTFGLWNLTFTGKASPTTTAVIELTFGQPLDTVFSLTTPLAAGDATFDRAYLDIAWMGFAWTVGRQTYTLGEFTLLYNEGGLTAPGYGADGVSVVGSLGGIDFTAAWFNYNLLATGLDVFMARASTNLSGWTFGLNFYTERFDWTAATAGTQSGWSVDISGQVVPGFTLRAEYASFTPTVYATTNETAWRAQADLRLATWGFASAYNPVLNVWYQRLGSSSSTLPGTWSVISPGSSNLAGMGGTAYPLSSFSNLNVWGATLTLTFSPKFRPYASYESGTRISSGAAYSASEFGFRSTFVANTTFRFRWQNRTEGVTATTDRYRLELSTSW